MQSGKDYLLRVNITAGDYGTWRDTILVKYHAVSRLQERINEKALLGSKDGTAETQAVKPFLAQRSHCHSFRPASCGMLLIPFDSLRVADVVGDTPAPHLRQAARSRHPYLHRPAQQKPEALQMDQVRRPDFGFRQTLLPQGPADFMWRTLDSRD